MPSGTSDRNQSTQLCGAMCYQKTRLKTKAHTDLKKLPANEKEVVWVKKGTQLFDNCWRQLKLLGLPKSTKAEDGAVHYRVREFQWHHWNAESDKFKAAGDVIQSLLAAKIRV